MTYEPGKPGDRDDPVRDFLDEDAGVRVGGRHRDPHDGGAADIDPQGRSDELERALAERDELKDLLLRTRAEFDNYRKRTQRERLEREADAAAGVLTELLPLVDDLERALEADAGSRPEPLRVGVELIHRQLLEMLRKRGVVPIVSVGADFDPHVHQAVEHMASAGHRDGEVIDELRRGYLIGGRLLRPAMVRVAKT
jgi:molecular chaperone GrpE